VNESFEEYRKKSNGNIPKDEEKNGEKMKKIRQHYHWVIAAVALVQLFLYGGASNNFSSYHMIPVTREMEIPRTAFALCGSVRSVVGVFSTLISGELIRRFGYRKMVSAALLTSACSYFLFAGMNSYWMLLLGGVMMGLTIGFCAAVCISRLIHVWFYRHRGLVLGVVSASTGIGSTVLGSMQAYLIEYKNWRLSFAAVAILFLVAALIMALFSRNSPQEMGLLPLGEGEQEKSKQRSRQWEGFSMEVLKRRSIYYLLIILSFLSCFCVVGTQFVLSPYFQDCGMSETDAGSLYGAMMLFLSAVKLLVGGLSDRIGAQRVTVFCHFACAAGLLLVLFAPMTKGCMLLALLIYDLGIPLTTMMFSLLATELFGNRDQIKYLGAILATSTAASMVSDPVANFVYDMTQSYRPMFLGVALLALVLILFYAVLFRRVRRDRKKWEAGEL